MEVTQYTALPPYTTFLYPKSRQYPFDEVCEKIVRALEKRNWKVPGIVVKFDDSGTGELKYRHVSTIKGEDFKLWFCRIQGKVNDCNNDFAAITEMIIPRKELCVHDDESGPTFYTYAGNNWENDKDTFMNGLKIHSKLKNKPKTYLEYTGSCDVSGGCTYAGKRSPYLVNDDDLGREYKACGDEPKYFHTNQVFQEINEWLNVNVLERIEAVKEVTDIELTTELSIPYPEHVGPFYLEIDRETYRRIFTGKKDKNQLEPSERYALLGGGIRLVTLNVRNDGSIPQEAYDGFEYCSFQKPDLKEGYLIFALVCISPKSANDIFVVDYEPSSQYKKKCFETNPEKCRLSDEEYYEYKRCLGRTIVPIYEYKGDYKQPVVLLGSSIELSFDEVEIIEVQEIEETTEANIIESSESYTEEISDSYIEESSESNDYSYVILF